MKTSGWLALAVMLFCVSIMVFSVFAEDDATSDLKVKRSSTRSDVNKATIKSVHQGLAWLKSVQNEDGSWGLDKNQPGDAGHTAMVLLAFMSDGSTPNRGDHAKVVAKGFRWLLEEIKRKGGTNIDYGNSTQLEYKLGRKMHLFMVAVLLAEMAGMEPKTQKEDLLKMMRDSAYDIAESQHESGGWDDNSTESIVTTVTAWLALRGAHESGASVGKASVDKVIDFCKSTYEPATGLFRGVRGGYGYQIWFSTSSCALRILYGHSMGNDKIVKTATQTLMKEKDLRKQGGAMFSGSGGEDYMAAMYLTHALVDTQHWSEWYTFIRDTLLSLQNADGSWLGLHCITSRVFCTACAVCTLNTPNRVLPMIGR